MNEKMPERIWLQNEKDNDWEATWAGNQINESDTEYVRADLVPQVPGEEEIEKLVEGGWSIKIFQSVKRMNVRGFREFVGRINWVAEIGERGCESRWEGFETAHEAITDMLAKLTPQDSVKEENPLRVDEKGERG
jgi:hypothetical protein